MAVPTLREALTDAAVRGAAIGHFNISDFGALKAIMAAAFELSERAQRKIPVLIGVSEGERAFIGVRQAAVLIRNLREQYDYPVYLNADHTHSLDNVRAAAEAGFDEILFDGSKLPMDENIAETREAVKIIRAAGGDIVIEGEIGYIGSDSEIVAERPAASLTLSTPDEAVRFVRETGVDVLAPAVGNMHGLLAGMAAGTEHKRLDIGRIGEIKQALAATGATAKAGVSDATAAASAAGSWMTLHGGSGTADEDFAAAVKAGMTIVHVSSELRLAWRRGVEEGLKNPNEIAPYKIVSPAVEGIKAIVLNRLQLFNGIS